jgi:hypothetical protein
MENILSKSTQKFNLSHERTDFLIIKKKNYPLNSEFSVEDANTQNQSMITNNISISM